MFTFSEAQIIAWISPWFWPFLRVLALFTTMPVLSTRAVSPRTRVLLAGFIAFAALPSLPPSPLIGLDDPQALGLVVQQVVIGMTLGFGVRIVFACVEFAGELIGLQMGLNFAQFFDPMTGGQSTAVSRFLAAIITLLFLATDGHLIVIAAVVRSFEVYPVAPSIGAFLAKAQPQTWAKMVFQMGLWMALPLIGMLLFVNIVLGVIARVAPQMSIFSIGFPITLSVGLVGLLATLPMLQGPFQLALEQMLGLF